MKTVNVNTRLIGEGQTCFIAAEIGINHNGDLDLAHRSIDAAADAGADAVKFQNYRTEDFLADRALTYQYVSGGKSVTESQFDMFKRCELASEHLRKLRDHCERRGLVFFSTPTSVDGVEELVRLGVPLLKNGSDYLVHLPLIRAMAQTGLPTVLSTGMATRAEIEDAVSAFHQAGGQDLILLHCTSSYPTPSEDVHLRRIPALAAAFDCPVGFSDHTPGNVAAIGAIALDSCFIEKHFTLDKNLPGPDHRFSADPLEFRALTQAIRSMEKNLGSAEFQPAASEELGRRDFRLSCVAARELPEGHSLTASDIAFRRPGSGFLPKDAGKLLQCILSRNIRAGHVFSPEDFVA
jgi:N,N'-diacetyllegionaminate synthase